MSWLLCLQEQRLRYLKQQEQHQQQQASEQEKLQRLRENIENQEARLKKVRALKGQVEQKRLSNGKLGELKFLGNVSRGTVVRPALCFCFPYFTLLTNWNEQDSIGLWIKPCLYFCYAKQDPLSLVTSLFKN